MKFYFYSLQVVRFKAGIPQNKLYPYVVNIKVALYFTRRSITTFTRNHYTNWNMQLPPASWVYPLQAHWLRYMPPGLTFKNAKFCSNSVLGCVF